jgi:hypothetical protein
VSEQPDAAAVQDTADPRSAATTGEGEAEAAEEGAAGACRFCPPEDIQKRWRESFGEAQKP